MFKFLGNIIARIEELDVELNDLQAKRTQQELKIEHIENLALRQRFQEMLDRVLQEQLEKQHERMDLTEMLKNMD